MNRFLKSIIIASGLTVTVALTAAVLSFTGLPFTTAAVPVINLFLLVLVLTRKEIDRNDIIEEVRQEKKILTNLVSGYETLLAGHRDDTKRARDETMAVAAEVKQVVADTAPPTDQWKPGDPDRRRAAQ